MPVTLESPYDSYKEIVFDYMKKHGLKEFKVCFDGEGDDGAIDYPYHMSSSKETKFSNELVDLGEEQGCPAKMPIRNMIEEICYKILENFDGWENGNGACGHFEFDPKKRVVNFSFNERVVEYETQEYEI